MRESQTCAGEHRDDGLGNHRHVDGHAIAGDQADLDEVVRGLAHLGEQLAVGEVAGVARLADPVDRHPVAVALEDMTVDAVVCDVEFAADKPLGERRAGPVEDVGEVGVPVQSAGLLGPEREPVGLGCFGQFRSGVGLLDKRGGWGVRRLRGSFTHSFALSYWLPDLHGASPIRTPIHVPLCSVPSQTRGRCVVHHMMVAASSEAIAPKVDSADESRQQRAPSQ